MRGGRTGRRESHRCMGFCKKRFNAEDAERAAGSVASCVVAPEGIALPGKTVLRSGKSKVAFAKAAALLMERAPIAVGIHPTAIVAPLARIGANVGIGPYAVIDEDAHVGD